ncbi:MAG: hypothetical protein ACJ74Y_11685 [Bryobacteraceae bacterium]
MSDQPIASLHNYSSRFLRSTDLVRDFDDPQGLNGYWLTDFGRSCLGRISDGFRPGSGRRTWRLTGDFGSGKSSFALLLAHSASDARRRLPKSLFTEVAEEFPEARKLRFIPVLVIGTRERVAPAILRAVFKVFGTIYSRRGIRSELELEIENLLCDPQQITDAEVLRLIEKTNRKIVQDGRGSGMLLILDELGKFLEFAAQNPDEQDVYFLQQLAEMAARSGRVPLVTVCLLHQGFNAYAAQLTPASQREWEKVAGRFEEIVFRQPLDQVALLIASALDVTTANIPSALKKEASAALDAGLAWGWFGTSASRDTLRRLAHRLFPLDPIVLPILVRTFQRFGQNERSLFSFLCSYEPFGMRAFSSNPLRGTSRPYRLADFYDYIRANFGHRLAITSYRTHWNVIESKIEAHPTEDALATRVLKTVGVLNLLNADDLRPTRDAICAAVAGSSVEEHRQVIRLLKKLQGRDLHFRGASRGYSLWPYTSVDIDARLTEAKRAIPHVSKVGEAIRQQLDNRPVVARAHYIRTGNLRYFDVDFCDPADLAQKATEVKTSRADGFILVPLCETKAHTEAALHAAKQIRGRDDLIQIIAVPRPLRHLEPAALDALRWEWVQEKTPELNNDPYARDEVHLHLLEARNRLQTQIQEFIGLNRVGRRVTLSWFYRGERIQHQTGREVMRWLSTLCDSVFDAAPQIRNELVNRHNLSSAAAAARMRLIELMFASSDKPTLGMPAERKPPERSMYLSVLYATGLHRKEKQAWELAYPGGQGTGNVLPTLERIRAFISNRSESRVSVSELLGVLRKPPFGLRDGLFPIFLAVIAIVEEQEIAFYENGTFLREIGRDAFLRMTKAPEKFDIQYCKIEGVRAEVFKRLVAVLDLKPIAGRGVELLDVVKPLCQFVAKLPPYVLNTHKLPSVALSVRDVILHAREPATLLFQDLPSACGLGAIAALSGATSGPLSFAKTLRAALDDLRAAYPEMHERLRIRLRSAFDLPGDFQQFRKALAERAEQILIEISEPKLRAFCLRLIDKKLLDSDWIESVGSYLALKPPMKWHDAEEDLFNSELMVCASRFHHVESIAFSRGLARNSTGVRLAITQADGVEHERVFHYASSEQSRLEKLQRELEVFLKKEGRIGLAAASRAILTSFNDHSRGVA